MMKNEKMLILIGEWLSQKRERKGYTQQQIAERMGKTRTAVHYWEAGKRSMTAKQLFDYAAIVDADLNDLMKYIQDGGGFDEKSE